MILILSEYDDESTNDVIDWLDCLDKKYIRINSSDEVRIVKVDLNSIGLIYDSGREIDLSSIQSFWYRRGPFHFNRLNVFSSGQKRLNHFIRAHSLKEQEPIEIDIYRVLNEKRHLGSFFNRHINKISVLRNASKVGLKIPDYIIATNRKQLTVFFEKHQGKIICKPTNNPLVLDLDDEKFMSYTCEVTIDDIQGLPTHFAPTLFQEEISKKFEIRTFVLDKSFYSMAIFSQESDKTKIDFRKYDYKNPNRVSTYKIPQKLEKQLLTLFQKFNLITGSVDLICNQEEDHIFLEINPIGQFGMVSYPCNYYLEKKIAEYL